MLAAHHLSIFVLARLALAFNPATDASCPSTGPCLSSFVWCSKDGDSCHFPAGVDELRPGENLPFAALYHGSTYEITWRNAEDGYPVLIEWFFEPDPFERAYRIVNPIPVMWSTNTTESSFTFDPQTILASFPSAEAPDMSPADAEAGAHGMGNIIRISQPDSPAGSVGMTSSQFTVLPARAGQLVDNLKMMHADELKKWKLGVGIGVGVGVPILMGLVWVATWWLLTRMGKKEEAAREGQVPEHQPQFKQSDVTGGGSPDMRMDKEDMG